jgi:hypothetical protein
VSPFSSSCVVEKSILRLRFAHKTRSSLSVSGQLAAKSLSEYRTARVNKHILMNLTREMTSCEYNSRANDLVESKCCTNLVYRSCQNFAIFPPPFATELLSIKKAVFWVVAPCSLVEVYRRFRGACCLHHQGDESHLLSIKCSHVLVTNK